MDGGAPTVEQETLCLSNGGGVLRLNMMTMNARRMKEQIDDPYDDPKCKMIMKLLVDVQVYGVFCVQLASIGLDTGCFLTVPPKFQRFKEKNCSTKEDLLYIENFMEQTL